MTPWTVACKVSLSMGFSRQEYWSGLPFPSPGDLPDPGIKPMSPELQAGSLPTEPPGKPLVQGVHQWSLEAIQGISQRIALHPCKVSSLSCHRPCPLQGHCITSSGQQPLNGTRCERTKAPTVTLPPPHLLYCKVQLFIQCSVLSAAVSVYQKLFNPS